MVYRSVFISDVHLGTKDCQADKLLEFIKTVECENLYLVGDIIDGWELKRNWGWLQSHSDVLQKILRKARKGVSVTYILGNHDEFLRPFLPIQLGDHLRIVDSCDYTALDGRRFLIVHGDYFDAVTMTKKWLALLGDRGYLFLLKLNRPLNWARQKLGYKYWSLSRYMKRNVKRAVSYIGDYETVLSSQAKVESVDGIICGHIHEPEIKMIEGILYINCGDWVESCSAAVETLDGRWMIINGHDIE